MMVHNDWKVFNASTGEDCNRCHDRVNAALWFNRGGGINFVQGPGFAVGETGSVYPQTFVDLQSSQASICYTAASPYGIRLAVVHPLPDPSHRYVYPRTNMPSLFSGAPLETDGIATFKTNDGWLHSKRNASLRNTFSIAMLVQPACNPSSICMLADSRGGADGRGVLLGLLPSVVLGNCSVHSRHPCGETGIDEPTCMARGCCFAKPYGPDMSSPECYTGTQNQSDTMRMYFYPAPGAPGSNLDSSFEIQLGVWSAVGASVTCESQKSVAAPAQNCTLQFFVNGKASSLLNLPRPHDGDFGGAVLKLARFIGSFRAVATFPGRALTQVEHNAWANQYAQNVSLPLFSPAAAVSPAPQLLLDPANASNRAHWQSSAPLAADAVQTADSGQTLVVCGQGSAGVDIPFLSGAAGETLAATLRFRVSSWSPSESGIGQVKPVGGQVVILTIGDSRHPLRVIVSAGQVFATRPSIGDALLGSISPGAWHVVNLALATATGEATIALDGSGKTSLSLGAIQSVWMYLGQGYRTNNTNTFSRTDCAELDLTTMDISVHRTIPLYVCPPTPSSLRVCPLSLSGFSQRL